MLLEGLLRQRMCALPLQAVRRPASRSKPASQPSHWCTGAFLGNVPAAILDPQTVQDNSRTWDRVCKDKVFSKMFPRRPKSPQPVYHIAQVPGGLAASASYQSSEHNKPMSAEDMQNILKQIRAIERLITEKGLAPPAEDDAQGDRQDTGDDIRYLPLVDITSDVEEEAEEVEDDEAFCSSNNVVFKYWSKCPYG